MKTRMKYLKIENILITLWFAFIVAMPSIRALTLYGVAIGSLFVIMNGGVMIYILKTKVWR